MDARPDTLPNTEHVQEDFKRPPAQSFVPNLTPTVTETEILRNALERGRQHLSMPSFSTAPIDTFHGTQRVFAMSFPHLFPFGKADFYSPRVRSVTLKEYARHLITYQDDRFTRDPMFRFVLFNILMRQKVDTASRFLVSRNSKLAQYIAE